MPLAHGSRFCHLCGAVVLSLPTPASNALSDSYTPPHLAQDILGARSALEGEHKRVTVLFCDIVDSTRLAERIGEERMYDLLNRFFEHTLEVVHRFKGTINQFLGDGFMALFGAPLALEHHEQHAILAGLGIRARLAEHFQDVPRLTGIGFEVRVGINTGPVVVGGIGDNLRMDYTAVGETTHVAARIQALAAPGEVLIAHATHEAVHGLVETQSMGLMTLKGRSTPLEVHKVLGAVSGTGALQQHGTRPLSRFVGREAEMAALSEALELARGAHGRAIGVVAEPGMGKSRLLLELRKSLRDDVSYLEGQCLSHGAAVPWLPILDILRTRCGISQGDSAQAVRRNLHAAFEAAGLDATAAMPCLLHLFGLEDPTRALAGLTAEMIQARTIDALQKLCLASSRRRPMVLVIEDLHWIDRSSERFIASLVDCIQDACVLLVVTHRPEYVPAWIDRDWARRIELRGLDDDKGQAIVQEVLAAGGNAGTAARDVVRRAEGNPLFLEELARAVTEQPGPSVAVPVTLLGVLAARIDSLPDGAKRALQMASVIGREFAGELLARVWDEGGALTEQLERLTRLEFVRERAGGADKVYVFKHALTRDAAYASLLAKRRQKYHRRVARALEEIHAANVDDVVELLAYQYGESDQDEKAVHYAMRAAQRASARWANAEALAHSNAAQVRLMAMPADESNRLRRIDLVLRESEVRFALGQHAEQLQALEAVGTLISPADDPARRAAWHYWMGFLGSITGGAAETSIRHGGRASAIAKTAGLEDVGAWADCSLAQVWMGTGELRRAIEVGERALEVFERRGDRWWACRALAQLSPTAIALGEWDRSLAYCRRALEHGIAMNDLRLKVSAFIRLASTQIQRGDWRAGLAHCKEAEDLAPLQYDAAALRAIRGHGLVKSGELAEGVAQISEALAWYDRSHQRYTHAQFSTWLADSLLRSSRIEEAAAVISGLLASTREHGYRYLEAVALRLHARCLMRVDAQGATRSLQLAMEITQAIDARCELAKTWLVATSFANTLVDAGLVDEVRARARGVLLAMGASEDE
ncbi:MAG: adenylate/guanylate cyclase domain-containing protein [Burkholderiaceae bacterium]